MTYNHLSLKTIWIELLTFPFPLSFRMIVIIITKGSLRAKHLVNAIISFSSPKSPALAQILIVSPFDGQGNKLSETNLFKTICLINGGGGT